MSRRRMVNLCSSHLHGDLRFHEFSQKLNNWLKKLNTGLRLERKDGFSSALICWTTWSRPPHRSSRTDHGRRLFDEESWRRQTAGCRSP